ncbi:hypothetical protein IT157_09820 [bacterium]|nr:hypothetical protein [bacterium]
MFACQWHFDVPFGKQKEVVNILEAWSKAMRKSKKLPKEYGERITVGHIGPSPSHFCVEHTVKSLADWEAMMHDVATGKYKKQSQAIAKYIVAGSQHWEILRVVK